MSKTEPVLVRAGSHSVTISPFSDMGFKEEVFVYFNATWRGQPAAVSMRADRYTHSSGLSEWRVYSSDVKAGAWDPETNWYAEKGDDLSGTARSRLGDELRPMVMEWLASEAYEVSERAAYLSAMRGMLYEARPYTDPTRDLRRVLAKYDGKLSEAQRSYIIRLASAYDAFARIYNEDLPS